MMTLSPDLVRKIEEYCDSQHDSWLKLGEKLVRTFGYDRKTRRISTQVRNLQQTVVSATKFSDIEDFVKNQMGRESQGNWGKVGDDVLEHLRKLRKASEELDPDPARQFAIRLRLAWAWVRAVVSQYLYEIAQQQM